MIALVLYENSNYPLLQRVIHGGQTPQPNGEAEAEAATGTEATIITVKTTASNFFICITPCLNVLNIIYH